MKPKTTKLFEDFTMKLQQMGIDSEVLAETIAEDSFLKEYTIDASDITSEEEEMLDVSDIGFFHFYVRMVKAYANDNDARFVMDGMAEGFSRYALFVSNPNEVQVKLLEAGSFMRGFMVEGKIDISDQVKAIAMRDILLIRNNGLLTSKQSNMLLKMQGYNI